MKDFLSIGDVAKIKGITPKALRYYEQLGILIPAYVNRETGYRYYTNDQLLLVDLILTCVDLDIPLKQFKTYISDQNMIDVERLLEDGSRIVDEKIRKLRLKKKYLRDISETAKRASRIKSIGDSFVENLPERYFLTMRTEGDLSKYSEINAKQSKLFYQCRSLHSSDGFNQGVLFLAEGEQLTPYAFLQVPKLKEQPDNLHIVPAGEFVCEVVTFEQLCDIEKDIPNLMIVELFDLTISPHQRLFEVQRPAD